MATVTLKEIIQVTSVNSFDELLEFRSALDESGLPLQLLMPGERRRRREKKPGEISAKIDPASTPNFDSSGPSQPFLCRQLT